MVALGYQILNKKKKKEQAMKKVIFLLTVILCIIIHYDYAQASTLTDNIRGALQCESVLRVSNVEIITDKYQEGVRILKGRYLIGGSRGNFNAIAQGSTITYLKWSELLDSNVVSSECLVFQ